MIVSGNQTAIAELLYLLDKDFKPIFNCKCGDNAEDTHQLICKFQSKTFEKNYGEVYQRYDIEYNNSNSKVTKMSLLDSGSKNILTGCVK